MFTRTINDRLRSRLIRDAMYTSPFTMIVSIRKVGQRARFISSVNKTQSVLAE